MVKETNDPLPPTLIPILVALITPFCISKAPSSLISAPIDTLFNMESNRATPPPFEDFTAVVQAFVSECPCAFETPLMIIASPSMTVFFPDASMAASELSPVS